MNFCDKERGCARFAPLCLRRRTQHAAAVFPHDLALKNPVIGKTSQSVWAYAMARIERRFAIEVKSIEE
jgi:hypothetical protein